MLSIMLSSMLIRQSLRSGCIIHNGTYLTLSLTLTITLTLLTLTITVRVTLTLPTLLTLILDTVVNKAPTSQGLPLILQNAYRKPIQGDVIYGCPMRH